MDVLARPWNGLILATLDGGALRFGELASRISGIGDRMLSLRLKELEAAGVILRVAHPGPPVRVEYSLTDAGRGFRGVRDAISAWGKELLVARDEAGRRAVAAGELVEDPAWEGERDAGPCPGR